MEKKHIIFIALFILIVGGAILGRRFASPKICGKTGNTVAIDMRALKNQWVWTPNPVNVNCGDHIVLNIYNEDDYDHGFALDVYGINKRMPPLTTTTVEFDATNGGEFIFYCSVPCGAGHFDQKGKLIVGKIISE